MKYEYFDYDIQPGLKRWNRKLVTDSKPLISIITPFYNEGKDFGQTYNCVIDQTFPWFEWIIMDDGSTDEESLQVLDELAMTDRRIKVYHQANGGPSKARNEAIAKASTDYIFPLDADDLIEPTCLEYEYWALQFNKDASWAFSDSCGFQGQEYIWNPKFVPEKMKKNNLLSITALIRKEDAIAVGNYRDEKFYFNEDWHFWLKMMEKGKFPVQLQGEILFWYRRSHTGVLSAVERGKESIERNEKIISEQAAFVINPEDPVIYPTDSYNAYKGIKGSDWEKKVYKKHEKIHILCLFPWLTMGGADKFNLDLLEGLDKNRYEISIITTTKSENNWIQRFRKVTPEIFNLPNFLSPENYPEFIDYIIKSREIDLIFQSNSLDGYYLLPWIRQRHPEVAIVDYVHMEEWYWRNGGYSRDSSIFQNVIEHTYICNNASRNVMIQHMGKKPELVDTVHIGIDETYFNPDRIKAGILYKELNIDQSRPIVLFICRLNPQKRPFLMLKIADRVRQQIEDVAFVVIGDGPQGEEMQEKVESMNLDGTVYFLGAKDEVRPYYRDAKVTLVCSMKEGLSLTAYESCAMGVPVITADVGGQSDLIDETVGVLIPCLQDEEKDFDSREFPQAEIKAYTDAIIEIIKNKEKWEKLSKNCRKRVEEGFTINNMICKMNSEFQRIVKSSEMRAERQRVSNALQLLDGISGELYTVHIDTGSKPVINVNSGFKSGIGNSEICTRLEECEKVLERHEEVICRHEEVVCRHEEVVCRHEDSINHQWGVQKWHEERLQRIEKTILGKVAAKLRQILH